MDGEAQAMSPSALIKQSARTASRVVGGRAVVVVIDAQALHTLSEVGTYVWERADGRSIQTVVDDVVEDFDVDRDRATTDVLAFVSTLADLGALVVERS
jgi:hypothetical protein